MSRKKNEENAVYCVILLYRVKLKNDRHWHYTGWVRVKWS